MVSFGLGLDPMLDPCPGHSLTPHGHCGGRVDTYASSPLAVFCTLPYFAMAYSCQANCFNAIGEVRL